MNKYTKLLAATCAATACLATTGHAATFVLNVVSDSRDQFAPTPTVDRDSDTSFGDFDEEIELGFINGKGRSTTSAGLIADPETGIFKSVTTASVASGPAFRASAQGISGITVDEEFTASGSGTATFTFAFDGILRAAGALGSGSVLAEMSIFSLIPGGGLATPETEWRASIGYRDSALSTFINNIKVDVEDELEIDGPLAEWEIDHEISVSIDLVDTQELGFQLRFQTAAQSVEGTSGSGGANFGSTGYLDFSTTDGLTLSASNPLFLSDAGGTTTPVPLSASLGFLMAGLGMLGAARLAKRA